MKKLSIILLLAVSVVLFSSCERVAPNFQGVLMENYGKSGKDDYSLVAGKVNTIALGTELFQVPLYDQRAAFDNEDGSARALHLKASDNTEFTATPNYTYKAIKDRCVDLVFQNSRLGSGDDFMKSLEENVLEPQIYDLIKEESKKYSTDTLMATGGSLKFEMKIQDIIKRAFNEKGLMLMTFSPNLDFSTKVKEKIDSRNEVNTNISVIDQKIMEQMKQNSLDSLTAVGNVYKSRGITPQLLQQQFIEKWDGKTPLYGNMPVTLFKATN